MKKFNLDDFRAHLQSELAKARQETEKHFKSDSISLKAKGELAGYERCLSNVLYSLAGYKQF
jgi:hypothetical protein